MYDRTENKRKNGLKTAKRKLQHEKSIHRKRRRSVIVDVFKDFNTNTSLHGLKYLSERGLSVFEKVFWLLTFLLSLTLCCLLIYNVWSKWQTSPMIVSFSEKMIPVWQVPFPSITICPQKKVKASVFNYTANIRKFYNDWDILELDYYSKYEKLDNIAMVCDQSDTSYYIIRDICNHTIVNDILEVSPEINDVFYDCKWRGKDKGCSEIFSKVITSEGICYNFNGLSANEMFQKNSTQKVYKNIYNENRSNGWSPEKGYTMEANKETYPHRGRENGAKPDLMVILKEDKTDQDNMCNSVNKGFKVYLHHPVDMPRATMYSYAVLPDQSTSLAVGFKMITTSEKLKSYSPKTRQCYFPSDRQLRYFQHYTQSNCENECRSNYTFERCGCVWYNMPHNNSGQICCNSNYTCVSQAKEQLAVREMELALQAAVGKVSEEGCLCLPACESVKYDAEVLKSHFDLKNYFRAFNILFNMTDDDEYDYANLMVYFKDVQFASMTPSELFGLTDFLANCGGLLGLFLGFSFLSLVEIIYFASLRQCCIIRRKRMKNNEIKKAKREDLDKKK